MKRFPLLLFLLAGTLAAQAPNLAVMLASAKVAIPSLAPQIAQPRATSSPCPTGFTHCNTLTWTWPWVSGDGDNATQFNVYRATTCAALSPLPSAIYATVTPIHIDLRGHGRFNSACRQ